VKALIPNFITVINLLCGTLAILCSFGGYIDYVPYLVLGGFVADFLDGFVARALNVTSPMGKELDSLADMISFGLLPGIIMYHLLNYGLTGAWSVPFNLFHAPAALIMAAFAAIRLAKFNVDERESDSFYGIPTPTTAAFVTALLCIALFGESAILNETLFSANILWGITVFASIMMVVDFPMISNKVKNFGWRDNRVKYLLLTTIAILVISLGYYGLALSYFAYILFSMIQKIDSR